MGFHSEIFRNLINEEPGLRILVLSHALLAEYRNAWHVGILRMSQWSDTGPSWPSCFKKNGV